MARFCPLFSSSKGNCTYIGDGESGILIDAGKSARMIINALKENGIDPMSIKAIFVTHEHSDHTTGLGAVAKKLGVPVFASQKTAEALSSKNIDINVLQGNTLTLDGFTVRHFNTCHDCEGSGGYIVTLSDERKVAVCTDTGVLTNEIKEAILGAELVMIESNHDVSMLQKGNYPYPLKQRILSEKGHLSNASCAEILPELVKNGTTRIILAHLSQDNNLPELARMSAVSSLLSCGYSENKDYILYVARPSNSKMISF